MNQLHFVLKFVATIFLLHLSSNLNAEMIFQEGVPGDKKVTLIAKRTSVQEIFKVITQQTGLRFSYNNKEIDQKEKITVHFVDIPVEKVLRYIFASKEVSWKYIDNIIRIGSSPKENGPSIIIQGKDNRSTNDSIPRINIMGKVIDKQGNPIVGASILVKGSSQGTVSDQIGNFILRDALSNVSILISSVGYGTKEVKVQGKQEINIELDQLVRNINAVEVISTGYQNISPERVTGSFSRINKQQLKQVVSSNIIDKINGAASGILFNPGPGLTTGKFLVRSIGTFGDKSPLIVVDNFPYEGEINNINPNDVESITVLKDAAAASIWGARAGNGVVVITTKSGVFNKKMQVNFSTSLSLTEKSDLFYQPRMSVAEYVNLEETYFDAGLYDPLENSSFKNALSPVVETLIARRDGLLTDQQAAEALVSFKSKQDMRNDLAKYIYQNSFRQRYSLNLSGGSANANYYLSIGHDRGTQEIKKNNDSRTTINIKNTLTPIKNLEIISSLIFTQNRESVKTNLLLNQFPYESLKGENSENAVSVREYRNKFKDSVVNLGLLNWDYTPLNEVGKYNNVSTRTDYLINTAVRYKITKGINIEARYQYERQVEDIKNIQDEELYEVRSLINLYSQINPDGSITRPIPQGSIADFRNATVISHSGRLQGNLNQDIGAEGQLSMVLGAEIRATSGEGSISRLYGFKRKGLTNASIDYNTFFPTIIDPGFTNQIYNPAGLSASHTRFISYFGNATYTLKDKYIITASARRDGSNILGVAFNQKWKPLWSAGLGWVASNESFLKSKWLTYLKVRASYGFTGNIGAANAYTTANYTTEGLTGLQYAIINNPPNPDLRWEKVQIVNGGIDFSMLNNRFFGSVEVYKKKGVDLIFNAPLDPTTGFFRGTLYSTLKNYANIDGHGFDIDLNYRILDKRFQWLASLIISQARSKVTKVLTTPTLSSYLNGSAIAGQEFGEMFAYKWGGLNGTNGDPIGYISGHPTQNYTDISTKSAPGDLVAVGTMYPTTFGSLRNELTYNSFTLNLNLVYKFNYKFKKSSIAYGVGADGTIPNNKDYSARWQKPGDENITNVPSIPDFSSNYNLRNSFYSNSEVLFLKADNIRIQSINLSYRLPRSGINVFKNFEVFYNMGNVGILWRANKQGLDPDVLGDFAPGKTHTLGIDISF